MIKNTVEIRTAHIVLFLVIFVISVLDLTCMSIAYYHSIMCHDFKSYVDDTLFWEERISLLTAVF